MSVDDVRPGSVLDIAHVQVVGFDHPYRSEVVADLWTCPTCGHRRSLEGSWVVRIRNLTGPGHERPVLICGECTAQVRARFGSP